jgi:hypothetical protein
MLKGTVSDLPFLIALRGTAKWVDALQVMRSTAKLLRGIHDPLPRELAVAGQLMTTQWALSLFVAEFVGNRQLCDDSEQRFLAKTLLNQCRKTNSEGLKQMLFRRFSTSGAVSLPQQIIFVTESSGWMSAMELVARNQSALHQTSVVEALFSSVVSGGRWELAASLYTSSHSYMRTRAFSIARLNGILAANGRWDLALHVLADVFAAGIITRSDLLPVFIPLVRNFCARGLWKDALHFSLAHGAMEHLRDCRRKDHAAPSPSLLPRSASTPRFTRHISALVYMLSQMDFYYHFHPQQLQGVCNIRAIDHGKQFNLRTAGYVHRHVSHIARHIDQSIVQTISGFKKYLQGPITQLTLNAPDDAILVVDTSFVIWCVVNRLPLDGFLSEIRRIYPHLENAPLRSFLCPFRVLMEASVLIERESSTTRSSLEILNRPW